MIGIFLTIALAAAFGPNCTQTYPADEIAGQLISLGDYANAPLTVTVSPGSADLVTGGTQQFTAMTSNLAGASWDVTTQVTWSASDAAVADVSNLDGSRGLVTALAPGQTTVSANYNGLSSAPATLTVTAFPTPTPTPTLVSIAVTPSSPTIEKGQTQQFTATGTYSNGSTADITTSVTWASLAPATASVNTAGLATAAAAGVATKQATLGALAASATLTVTAPTLVSITVTPSLPSIAASQTQQFTATGNYSDAGTQDLTSSVTWQSGNPAVATINSSGLATGKDPGSAVITATLGISGNTTLTVTCTAGYAAFGGIIIQKDGTQCVVMENADRIACRAGSGYLLCLPWADAGSACDAGMTAGSAWYLPLSSELLWVHAQRGAGSPVSANGLCVANSGDCTSGGGKPVAYWAQESAGAGNYMALDASSGAVVPQAGTDGSSVRCIKRINL